MKKQVVLIVVMFLIANYAHAAIITQTGSWNLSEGIVVTTPINYTNNKVDSILFSQFNPDLGDLIGVEFLRISGVCNSRLYIRNLSQQSGNFVFSQFNVVGYAAGVGLWYPTLDESLFFSTYSSGGAISPEPLQGWLLVAGGGIDEEGSNMQYYSGQELDLFIGYGTFDMSPRIEISYIVSSISPGAEALFEINYAFSYAISYIYEPISEPTTLLVQTEPNDINTVTPSVGLHTCSGWVDVNASRFVDCPKVYCFDNWVGDVEDANSANTRVFMNSDKTITAVFRDNRQCGDECHPYPAGDIDKNCIVDFNDFGLFALSWLECTKPECD